jgi:hypothetical protein
MFNLYRSLRLFLVLFTGLALNGCIEIMEEIIIHEDESGTVSYRIDHPGPSGLLGDLMRIIEPAAEKGIIMEAERMIQVLESQKGISNLEYSLHGRSGTYFVRFDFDDCADFNDAIYAMGGARKTILTPNYMKIKKNRFKKFNFTPSLNRYLKKEELSLPSPILINNVTFRSVVHTPGDIRKVKNGSSMDARTAVQQFEMSDILSGDANTGIKVRY